MAKVTTVQVLRAHAIAILSALGKKVAKKSVTNDTLTEQIMELEEAPQEMGSEELNNLVDAIFGADAVEVVDELEEGEEAEAEEEEVEEVDLEELDRKQLKAFIKDNELDIKVMKSMSDDDIRTAIAAASEGDEEVEEAEEEETTTKTSKKKTSKKAAKKTSKKAAKTSKKAAKKATIPRVGIITTIVELLTKKAYTKAELLEALKTRFPDRPEKGMMHTITCQVPNRLKSEKDLNVVKLKDGRFKIK